MTCGKDTNGYNHMISNENGADRKDRMSQVPNILIVDDHAEIRKSISSYLKRHGMKVEAAENTEVMDEHLSHHNFDLVVLDVMMPGEDGIAACKRLRSQSDIPILMLTALGEDDQRIDGLDSGADDYLSKPFNPRELLARINAILRRAPRTPVGDQFAGKVLRFSHLLLDYDGRTLIDAEGQKTLLTSGELTLLCLFLKQPRVVISREDLLFKSTGRTAGPFDRTIDNHISRLRRKIEKDVLRPRIITTVRNGGYSFSCEVEVVS